MPDPFEHINKRFDKLEEILSGLKNIQPEIKKPIIDALPDCVKIAEAALITGYKPSYVYQLVEEQRIPFNRLRSGSLRFSRKELDLWIRVGRPPIMQKAVDQILNPFVNEIKHRSKPINKSQKTKEDFKKDIKP